MAFISLLLSPRFNPNATTPTQPLRRVGQGAGQSAMRAVPHVIKKRADKDLRSRREGADIKERMPKV